MVVDKNCLRPWNVVQCLINYFPEEERIRCLPFTAAESQLAFDIYGLIGGVALSGTCSVDVEEHETGILKVHVEEEETLDKSFGRTTPTEKEVEETSDFCVSDAAAAKGQESDSEETNQHVNIKYKKKAVDYWLNEKGTKQLSFRTVQSRFKLLKHRTDLYRWEKQVSEEGDRLTKAKFVANAVLKLFNDRRERNKVVHDYNVRRWALDAPRSINYTAFRASRKWVHSFKKANRIRSRKITKFVTHRQVVQDEGRRLKGQAFVEKVRDKIQEVGASRVYNTDQSGFNKEFFSGRTLSNCGEKTVLGQAQSQNSLTHSYTIQPAVGADGRLLPKLLVILQETGGVFGPIVKETMFRSDNLHITCSTSGKSTKAIVEDWLHNVYLPNVQDESVLTLDSWTGQTEQTVSRTLPEGKSLEVHTIPEGTTGFAQVLDVYGFRVWKGFVRYFNDLVILHDLDVNIHFRDNILRIQAFTHNQLSSPRYVNLWKYGWFKAGYISVVIGQRSVDPLYEILQETIF